MLKLKLRKMGETVWDDFKAGGIYENWFSPPLTHAMSTWHLI